MIDTISVITTERIIYTIISIIGGWLTGRVAGWLISYMFSRSGLDTLIEATSVGKILVRIGGPPSKYFDVLTRLFIYMITLEIIAATWEITVAETFIRDIAFFIPRVAFALIITMIGGVIAKSITDELTLKPGSIMNYLVNGVAYIVVALLSLAILGLDPILLSVLLISVTLPLTGLAIGVGISVGWGIKDTVAKNIRSIIMAASMFREETAIESLRSRMRVLEDRMTSLEEKASKPKKEVSPELKGLKAVEELVGDAGVIETEIGGYRIVIKDPSAIDWQSILDYLSDKYSVRIDKEDGKIIIHCKYKPT